VQAPDFHPSREDMRHDCDEAAAQVQERPVRRPVPADDLALTGGTRAWGPATGPQKVHQSTTSGVVLWCTNMVQRQICGGFGSGGSGVGFGAGVGGSGAGVGAGSGSGEGSGMTVMGAVASSS
jgi:hypothetical protein